MSKSTEPKVLFFDIETSPILAWVWRTGSKIRITHNQIKQGMISDIICVCWKWSFEKGVRSLDWGFNEQNSTKMLEVFTKELEKADLAIAHNGNHFDVRHLNTQRLLHNQRPIVWPTIEDSLTQFRKLFYMPSYKLDFLGKTLVDSGKDTMAFQDWIDVVERNNPAVLQKMIKYCKKDVLMLEKVFNKARAFFKPKINMGLVVGGGRFACPRCGSSNVQRNGLRRTLARTYQRIRCNSCGTSFTGPTV